MTRSKFCARAVRGSIAAAAAPVRSDRRVMPKRVGRGQIRAMSRVPSCHTDRRPGKVLRWPPVLDVGAASEVGSVADEECLAQDIGLQLELVQSRLNQVPQT